MNIITKYQKKQAGSKGIDIFFPYIAQLYEER